MTLLLSYNNSLCSTDSSRNLMKSKSEIGDENGTVSLGIVAAELVWCCNFGNKYATADRAETAHMV